MEIKYNCYDMNHLEQWKEHVLSYKYTFAIKRKKKQLIKYLNTSSSFDIETTSTYLHNTDTKIAFMYMWSFGINGVCIIGRTWEDYQKLVKTVINMFELGANKRLCVYVHNLAFEFNFLRSYFNFSQVFASDMRKPIYAVAGAFEYRCSYILTNKSLADLAKECVLHKVSKMVGDLDYSLIRTSKTSLYRKEIKYSVNDVRVVMFYIDQCIYKEKKITSIPLTATGYVRRSMRNKVKKCIDDWKLIQNCKLDVESYMLMNQAYMGGFCHANVYHVNQILLNVASFDFTSSYPAVMLAEKYPCTSPVKRTISNKKELDNYLKYYCCIFEIRLMNVQLKSGRYDAPLPISKCIFKSGTERVVDNGRVRSISDCITYITEVDFEIYKEFYDFDFEIGTFYTMQKDYLPKSVIEEVLDYYEGKTVYKDVPGAESIYNFKKSLLNSLYGMQVTAVLRNEIIFENGLWDVEMVDFEKQMEFYNNNKNRATFYPVGIYISAYARRNVLSGVLECGNDYIYSDTDSIKILNYMDHLKFINRYNEEVVDKINACLRHYNIDVNKARPVSRKGEAKQIGIWSFEGVYKKFKTLGSKRYMYEDQDGLHITIAGVNKKSGSKYMKRFADPFAAFNYDLIFDKDHAGKLTHTYIDDLVEGDITDYQGNTEHVVCKSGVHLEATSYEMSCSDEYFTLQHILGTGGNNVRLKI